MALYHRPAEARVRKDVAAVMTDAIEDAPGQLQRLGAISDTLPEPVSSLLSQQPATDR